MFVKPNESPPPPAQAPISRGPDLFETGTGDLHANLGYLGPQKLVGLGVYGLGVWGVGWCFTSLNRKPLEV